MSNPFLYKNINVEDPSFDKNAANKKYVDDGDEINAIDITANTAIIGGVTGASDGSNIHVNGGVIVASKSHVFDGAPDPSDDSPTSGVTILTEEGKVYTIRTVATCVGVSGTNVGHGGGFVHTLIVRHYNTSGPYQLIAETKMDGHDFHSGEDPTVEFDVASDVSTGIKINVIGGVGTPTQWTCESTVLSATGPLLTPASTVQVII